MATYSSPSKKSLEPLEKLLHTILSRLEAIESRVGIETTPSYHVVVEDEAAAAGEGETLVPPALAAYDAFIAQNIVPLVEACAQLAAEDGKMKEIGDQTQVAFASIRSIIELASLCQKPATTTAGVQQALTPYVKHIQVGTNKTRF